MKKILNYGAVIISDIDSRMIANHEFARKTSYVFSNSITKIGEPVFVIDQFEELKKFSEIVRLYLGKCNDTVFIFPGRSALQIRMSCDFFRYSQCIDVYAKRTWVPGCNPFVTVGTIHLNPFIMIGIKNVIVVDDVVSSGVTLKLLYERNVFKFPKAKWHAVTLISRKLKIPYYESISSMYLIEDKNGKKIPINSISSFVEDREILESYLCRNFQNPQLILDSIY